MDEGLNIVLFKFCRGIEIVKSNMSFAHTAFRVQRFIF